MAGFDDPDDYEGELDGSPDATSARWSRNAEVATRLGPLLRWADRIVEDNPALASAAPSERMDHFRRLLPPTLPGRHALCEVNSPDARRKVPGELRNARFSSVVAAPGHEFSDLEWTIGHESYWTSRPGWARRAPDGPSMREMVVAIVAAGHHGELNRRIRQVCSGLVTERTVLPPTRVIDDDHPAPGILIRGETVVEHRRIAVRYLAGAHDIDKFATRIGRGSAASNIVRQMYRELT